MLEEALILVQIIFIDIILAADNAIIIGLIAANFAPKNRRQIILWGVAGALIFKIVFAVFATYLFEFYFVKILGGILLIWIARFVGCKLWPKQEKPSALQVNQIGSLKQLGLFHQSPRQLRGRR